MSYICLNELGFKLIFLEKQNEKEIHFFLVIALAFIVPITVFSVVAIAEGGSGKNLPARPEGPCDIYAADGNPCVAAHSTTRALFASYNGPLYQVMRQSDGKTLDIGVVQPSEGDPGGYADAAAQDAFCANTYCWITVLYDQSDKKNHLVQAPRGGFSGPAMGGFNNLPLADWAPVTLMGHKVYGIFIAPGMGLRWNDARGTAVDDQAEGQYWVVMVSTTIPVVALTTAMPKRTAVTMVTAPWKQRIMKCQFLVSR